MNAGAVCVGEGVRWSAFPPPLLWVVSQWECPPDFSTPHHASNTRGTSSSSQDGSAGTKRGVGEAEDTTRSKRQSTRHANPYGEWTTVAVR